MHLDLDLRFADGSLVRGVNARRVAHVRAFRPGHYVAYGDWVGKIHDVVEDVVVRFEDGAECVVAGADEETLVPRDRSTLFADEEHCPFFPGAVVHAAANVWRDARWTRGTRSEAPSLDGGGRGEGDDDDEPGATAPTAPAAPARKKKSLSARVSAMRARTKGVVFEVRAAEVTVRWLACARKSETDEYDYSAKGAFPRAPRTPGLQAEGRAGAADADAGVGAQAADALRAHLLPARGQDRRARDAAAEIPYVYERDSRVGRRRRSAKPYSLRRVRQRFP